MTRAEEKEEARKASRRVAKPIRSRRQGNLRRNLNYDILICAPWMSSRVSWVPMARSMSPSLLKVIDVEPVV